MTTPDPHAGINTPARLLRMDSPAEMVETVIQETLDRLVEWIEACRVNPPLAFVFLAKHKDINGGEAVQAIHAGSPIDLSLLCLGGMLAIDALITETATAMDEQGGAS